MSSVVKQLMYVLKLFRVTTGSFHSFQIRSIETLQIMYPKYLVLDMIHEIHLCCGSFGSVLNPFLDFNKEMKYPFLDQKSGLDFSKEMHPKFREA